MVNAQKIILDANTTEYVEHNRPVGGVKFADVYSLTLAKVAGASLLRWFGQADYVILNHFEVDNAEGMNTNGAIKAIVIATDTQFDWIQFAKVQNGWVHCGRGGIFFQAVQKIEMSNVHWDHFGHFEQTRYFQLVQPSYPTAELPNAYPVKYSPGGQGIKIDNNVNERKVDYTFSRLTFTNTSGLSGKDLDGEKSSRGRGYRNFVIEDGGHQEDIRWNDCRFDSDVRHYGTASGNVLTGCTFGEGSRPGLSRPKFVNCIWENATEGGNKASVYAGSKTSHQTLIDCEINLNLRPIWNPFHAVITFIDDGVKTTSTEEHIRSRPSPTGNEIEI